ncbi:MAG: hypothetical protein ACR2OM_12025 [Aestuariivirgaceae bacterium]
MIKQTLFGLAIAGAVAMTGLTVQTTSAEAGVKIFVTPGYNAYGTTYHGNYFYDDYRRCHWERRKVRRRVCWRNDYGRKKCRWKKRWRKVKVC